MYPMAVSIYVAAYSPQVWPAGGLKMASSLGVH